MREAGIRSEALLRLTRSAVIRAVVVVAIRVRRTMLRALVVRMVAHPFVALPVTVAVPIAVAMPAEVQNHIGLHHVRLRIILLRHGAVNHAVIDLSECGRTG